ncbi:hypothetical protein Taro_031290 [Colocasia esculenta]|uniref:Uncharacterized protein n=1 Tax=Colocasia esculenta TaxID=4460 RepID=A0A843VYN0_COLES|nr:hypothetical protein [Colocasia esculenta]
MEDEMCRLQRSLEEKDGQLQASTSSAEQDSRTLLGLFSHVAYGPMRWSARLHLRLQQDLWVSLKSLLLRYLKELENLRNELSVSQAAAEDSAASARSAETQCLFLLKELDEKNSSLKEHEERVNRLGEQLDLLQEDLRARELSQNQLKDEVVRIEREIMEAVANAGANKDCELKRILEEVSPQNLENLNKHLNAKDEEISRLRDEIRFISAHWKHRTKELESQLDKHRRADQELKKRVVKLEFCLQETRAQTRKLQRMGEKREKVLKELREQLAMKEKNEGGSHDKPNFWESSGFKMIISMSMLVLVVIAKR